ncbi:MAG TPA: Uma2 family endonuclease [Ferruginibacter sp.]|nr:Uma2 family endonuclease [Ferruginibacter sp.]
MRVTHKILPHYTYEDYKIWEGNWELIDGFPIAMIPSPVPKHQLIAASLIIEIGVALKKCNDCRVYDATDYLISEDTVVQPDVMVLCKKPTKKFIDFTPSLVAEILSPSTALRDRNTKYELYQNEGIKYYLIVDADAKKIEIYELLNNRYTLVNENAAEQFEFILDEECRANVNLDDVWKE